MTTMNKETNTCVNNNEIKVINALAKATNSLRNKLKERGTLVIDGQSFLGIVLILADKSGENDTSFKQFSRSMAFKVGETIDNVIDSAVYISGEFYNVIGKHLEEDDVESYEVYVSVRIESINTDTNEIKVIESASSIEG